MNTQNAILELIANDPMTINKIASNLAISPGYIRTQIKAMEIGGLVEKVDDRLPHYYRVCPTNTLVLAAEKVLKTKKQLLLPVGEEDMRLMKLIKSAPKSEWLAIAETLKITAAAIEALDTEGKLVDIL